MKLQRNYIDKDCDLGAKLKLEKKRGSLEHLESLSTLVEELKKDEPNQEYLKKHMQNIGLKFENDPIENIGKIIAELNSFEFKEQ